MSGNDFFSLAGKTAIITGSSRGIGRAIAERMAQYGANVVISSRKPEACESVAAGINARGEGRAIAVPANISSKADLERLVGAARGAFEQIDVLVCNAAVNPFFGPLLDTPDEALRKVLECNIVAQTWLVQLVAPEMQQRRDGAVILISSISGLQGTAGLGAYAISKAADIQLARNFAVELSPWNIRFNCIAPGLVKTDFAKALWDDPEQERKAIERTPLRRLGEPDDIAGAAVFLASRAGAWITGQTLVVDGGETC